MTRSLSRAGLDRLHQAMADRVARGELPGMVILILLAAENSVRLMTTNHLTPAQMAGRRAHTGWTWLGLRHGRRHRARRGVVGSRRYGWDGGYGTAWFNHPDRNLVAIAMTQTASFLFNGAATEFASLAVSA